MAGLLGSQFFQASKHARPNQVPREGLPPPPMPRPAPHSEPNYRRFGMPPPWSMQGWLMLSRALKESPHAKGGGPSANDALNAIINLGGLAAPPGAGAGAGALKGLTQQLRGTQYNRNGLSPGRDLLYGPSFGERAMTGLGNAIHDLTHGPDSVPPNSQAMSSGMQGGFPPFIPQIRPLPKPLPIPTPRPKPSNRPTDEEILRALRQYQDNLWRNVPASPTS